MVPYRGQDSDRVLHRKQLRHQPLSLHPPLPLDAIYGYEGEAIVCGFQHCSVGMGVRFTTWLTSMAPTYPCLEQICLVRVTVDVDDLFLLTYSSHFYDLSLLFCDDFSTVGIEPVGREPSKHPKQQLFVEGKNII
ncbi:hypothetical protein KSP39_PZI015870 [Platanthera zijinensis]|uniref:Uncharacterized protein n=1 Tax=Platanthera zijinensis TaxID=2320716 RepID=A0AAP0B8V9_9ASPA